jgi:hypothetical protein
MKKLLRKLNQYITMCDVDTSNMEKVVAEFWFAEFRSSNSEKEKELLKIWENQ